MTTPKTHIYSASRGKRGFTLTEVLITLVIIAIVASIAVPSYQGQMRKSRRGDAKEGMVRIAQQMERCFTRYRVFNSTDCPQVVSGPTINAVSSNGHYRITSVGPGGETLGAESFTLFATPVGDQAADTICASYRLTNHLARSARDDAGNDTTAACW